MREHDALGEAGGAGGVHEERDVVDGVDFCASPFERGARVYELAEVQEARGARVADEDDAVFGDAGGGSGFPGGGEELGGSGDRFRARVLELECEFLGGVVGVCRCDDAGGPQSAPGYDGGVDLVRAKSCNVRLLLLHREKEELRRYLNTASTSPLRHFQNDFSPIPKAFD